MAKVTVNSVQTKLLQDSLAALPGAALRGQVRAVNRVAAGVRKEIPKWIVAVYAIPQNRVLKHLTVSKASVAGGVAEAEVIAASTKGQPLVDFVVGNKSAPSTRRTKDGGYTPAVGVPVMVLRSQGKKPVTGGFIAAMTSGHVGLFSRVPGSKKIQEKFLPSLVGILEQEEYSDKVASYIDQHLPEALAKEVDRELQNA